MKRARKCKPKGIKDIFFGDKRINMMRPAIWLADEELTAAGTKPIKLRVVLHNIVEDDDGNTSITDVIKWSLDYGVFNPSEETSLYKLAEIDHAKGLAPMKFLGYLGEA